MKTSTTFKIWTHPQTGDKRAYINSDLLPIGHKLYITIDSEGFPFAKVTGDWVNYDYRGIDGGFKLADFCEVNMSEVVSALKGN